LRLRGNASQCFTGKARRRAGPWLALTLAALFLTLRPAYAGYSSVVIDDTNGDMLHEMNADVANYPASLTKIMTLYLAFEALAENRISLKEPVTVSDYASVQAPSKLGLEPGESIAVENLILGIVTKSANDAAVALAEAVAGSESAFAQKMTAKAHQLGMTATEFRNASGLPDPDQVTTARDMAILARAVLHDFPQYYHYFGTPRFAYNGMVFENHNRMLKTYAGADGLKTGYIRASGFNLVTSAERGGRRLIGVVMGSQSPSARNAQMARLLDASFLGQTTRLAALAGKPEGASASSAPPAPSKAARAAKPTGPDRSWGVQVGAFSRFAPAHLAATKAARAVPRLLSHSKVAVDTTADEGSTVYRARVMGLTQLRARKACAALAAKKMECLMVAGDGSTTAASTEQGDTDQSGR
jgi:D-alanyl-D-alanine carboxypeptidase